MERAIQEVRTRKLTNKFDVLNTLMNYAEKLSPNGPEKKRLVLEAYTKLAAEDSANRGTYGVIPITTVELIIDTLIYASKTAIEYNKSTNFLSKLTAMCKKDSSV